MMEEDYYILHFRRGVFARYNKNNNATISTSLTNNRTFNLKKKTIEHFAS